MSLGKFLGTLVITGFSTSALADSWFEGFEIATTDIPAAVKETAAAKDPSCKRIIDAGKHPGTEIYAIDCGGKRHNIKADGTYVGVFKDRSELTQHRRTARVGNQPKTFR
jgi:hypothetical protein